MNATEQRVGKIAVADLDALAPFRARTGWQLCVDDADRYWLRVPAADDGLFRKLPLLGRWSEVDGGRIIRESKRVPEALLPIAGWQALATRLPIMPPTRGAPGMPPAAIGFQLEPDDADFPAAAMLCAWAPFAAWAEAAFAPRIEKLHFACSDDGRAFITGDPLPAIPGSGFHRRGRLWLPCGYRLPGHVWPELVEEAFALGGNRFAILHADGTHEEMDQENLIPATRAAVRITGQEEPLLH